MAKDDKGGKIRVLFVELEGSNETLQESLRTLTTAFGRGISPARQVVSVQPALPSGNAQQAQIGITDNGDHEELEEVAVPVNRPKRQRTYRNPTVLDIELRAGDMPFVIFCQQKNPASELKKYLVIATWLKQYRGIEEIGPDHIYTCYKTMRWTPPKDLGQTFRQGRKSGYFRALGKGIYSINHVGEGLVDDMGAGA